MGIVWAGLPILVGLLLLRSVWQEQGGVSLDVATAVGVLAFIVQVIGLRAGLLRSWLAWGGIGTSAIYFLAQTELIATVMPDFPVVPEVGFVGSTLWLLWLIGLGVSLLRTRAAAQPHEIAVLQ